VSEERGNTLFGTIRGHGKENQLAVTASSTTSHQGIAIGVWDANELGSAETSTNLHIRYDLCPDGARRCYRRRRRWHGEQFVLVEGNFPV
jgi:hypothetical protein